MGEGRPDLTFVSLRAVVFVDGCFWHGHEECKRSSSPKTRPDYWRQKIERNRSRDRRNREALTNQGWRVLSIWECEIGPTGLHALYEALTE